MALQCQYLSLIKRRKENKKDLLKSKTVVPILLIFLLALTLIVSSVAGWHLPPCLEGECEISFYNAKIYKDDGSVVTVPIEIQVDDTAFTTPFSICMVECEKALVKIPTVFLDGDGRYYRFWRWNMLGNINYRLVGNPQGHMNWQIHAKCVDSALEPKYARAGAMIDVLRLPVIRHPDAALIAMQTGTGEVSTDLIRTGDIEKLDSDGHTITFTPGFHMGHIGYNIRPLSIQQERRPELTVWPLADVDFRHALFHCYDQDSIVASIYGYTVTPVQSLVPPAYGGWENTEVPKHPYNPGDPFTSPAGEHSSCGILKAAGYTFEDHGTIGVVDSADYWNCPNGDPVPNMHIYTPTYETAPTSAEHAARFVTDLGEIGLAATGDNGGSGFVHEPAEFADYMDKVDVGNFDAYMVFWSLGRFPDHLYDMCHSSQDSWIYPKRYNHPGINDPEIDSLVNTIKTSLNHAEKLQAAWDVQKLLYDPTCDQAMAYMQLYSRILFNGFNPDLRGIINSPGYGSDNGWTYLNMHWEPGTERYTDGKTLIKWIWGEYPERMNPCYASTVYAWSIIDKTLDGLIDVNPYTLEDMPGMAEDWNVTETPTGMNVTFQLRKDVFWQDGNGYTAEDAKFNWLFLRDNEIPRYTSMWQYIDDVEVLDTYKVRVILSTTSQFLLYDLAGTAALLPPCVWEPWNGKPMKDILGYDPSADTTAPAGAGPWFGTDVGPGTCLFGTGAFVFDYYDKVGGVTELHQWAGYHRITTDIQDQLDDLFYAVGDVNRDGLVWAADRGQMGVRFGCRGPPLIPEPEPCYSAEVDVNKDGIIDMGDLSLANYFYGDQKEYP